MSIEPQNDAFLLGTIAATVTGTAEDVKAIRNDVGDLARRLNGLENRVEAIETSRETLLPDYDKWRHRMSNEVTKLTAWQLEKEGAFKGGSIMGKLMLGAISMLGGAGLITGWQSLHHDKVAKDKVTVERTVTAPSN